MTGITQSRGFERSIGQAGKERLSQPAAISGQLLHSARRGAKGSPSAGSGCSSVFRLRSERIFCSRPRPIGPSAPKSQSWLDGWGLSINWASTCSSRTPMPAEAGKARRGPAAPADQGPDQGSPQARPPARKCEPDDRFARPERVRWPAQGLHCLPRRREPHLRRE